VSADRGPADPTGETVAVIPARGGSKGVPRKNLRRVGGIPLIARAITTARAADRIDRVVVSTDDPQIAAVAHEWGADVVTRPAALSGDTASSESAVEHALGELARLGIDVGVVVLIQATSPFIDPADVDAAVERVRAGESDCVFSAVESWGFLWRTASAGAVGINHDHRRRPRRQEREPEFLETGAFYVMDAAGFRSAKHRFFGRIGIALVPEAHAIEIDTEEQLALASIIEPVVGRAAGIAAGIDSAIDVDAVVTDFDGVHTDDTVLVGEGGEEFVRVSRSDGMGIGRLRAAGIPVLILSTETNPVVTARARKLGVDVAQGSTDKATALRAWASERDIPLDRIAYLGNDINDLGCLEVVGWPIAVPAAHPEVIAASRIVLAAPGGAGAVRELADAVLLARTARSRPSHAETTRPQITRRDS